MSTPDLHGLQATEYVPLWLQRSAVRLDTVDPSANMDDLAAVGSLLSNAQVVGLGDASHGTREFFLFRHRLNRYLVRKLGFNTLLFEANW